MRLKKRFRLLYLLSFYINLFNSQEKHDENNHQEITVSEPEIVIGTGQQCFPHDHFDCYDGRLGTEVQLIYPKDLAFGSDGTIFFIDGSTIRMQDSNGRVRLIVGHFSRRQWRPISCHRSHPSFSIKLIWPTSLAINPIDGALYFVDNHSLMRLDHNLQVSIIAGHPSFCLDNFDTNPQPIQHQQHHRKQSKCQQKRQQSASIDEWLQCQRLLFDNIVFDPSGQLYLTEIGQLQSNRIFSLTLNNGMLRHIAGYYRRTDRMNSNHCPIEKCIDMAGENCTCLIANANDDDDYDQAKTYYNDGLVDQIEAIALRTRFHSITSMTVIGDGTVYLADEGSLRIYSLRSYLPELNEQNEIKILQPNTGKMFIFDREGFHLRTRNILTGRTLYNFLYNRGGQNDDGDIDAQLAEVIDFSGHKLSFIRNDRSGTRSITISTTSGVKCTATLDSKLSGSWLHSFTDEANRTEIFNYYPNGLVRSRYDLSTGQIWFHRYDESDGRLKELIEPDGSRLTIIELIDQQQNRLISSIHSPLIGRNDNIDFVENPSLHQHLHHHQHSSKDRRSSSASTVPLSLLSEIATDHQEIIDSIIKIESKNLRLLESLTQSNQFVVVDANQDDSLMLNTTFGLFNVHLDGHSSTLAHELLPLQAQLFSPISKFRLTPSSTSASSMTSSNLVYHQELRSSRSSSSSLLQPLSIEIDYVLRLKSSFIDSVVKSLTIVTNPSFSSNSNQSFSSREYKIEYDWNTNREIYFNQSNQPILFLQYDDYGRPIQWSPSDVSQEGRSNYHYDSRRYSMPSSSSSNDDALIGWLAHKVSYYSSSSTSSPFSSSSSSSSSLNVGIENYRLGLFETLQNGNLPVTEHHQRDSYGRLTELRRADTIIRYGYDDHVAVKDDKIGEIKIVSGLNANNNNNKNDHQNQNRNDRIYQDDGANSNNNNDGSNEIHRFVDRLPSTITMSSGHRYRIESDSSDPQRFRSILLPNGSRHNLSISMVFGHRKFIYCPPSIRFTPNSNDGNDNGGDGDVSDDIFGARSNQKHLNAENNAAGSNSDSNVLFQTLSFSPLSHCYQNYYETYQPELSSKLLLRILPHDSGKIAYQYRQKSTNSREFFKEYLRFNDVDLRVDRIIQGNGLNEIWYDSLTNRVVFGLSWNDRYHFGVQYKYAKSSGLLKHQSYVSLDGHRTFSSNDSIREPKKHPLIYSYRYDGQKRLRSIQVKLETINLASIDYSYSNNDGRIESISDLRYFERSPNETLLGDGIALFVKRYDDASSEILDDGLRVRRRIRHHSLTVSDKEIFRSDHIHDQYGRLIQTRTFLRHLNAKKISSTNYTYDDVGQLIETQSREHWRFHYDPNGNLITIVRNRTGNRIDFQYDHSDRLTLRLNRHHQHSRLKLSSTQPSSSPIVTIETPYVYDLRGFLVRRGDEHFIYNNLGHIVQAFASKRYKIDYFYDHLGRLISRGDHLRNQTQFFYGNPLKPSLITHMINNADGSVQTLIYDDDDDSLVMIKSNSEQFYVICDPTRTPTLIFDHRGEIVKEINRSPFGHVVFDSNPNFHLPVDFHGGYKDPQTGLVYLGPNQIYDTFTGRYFTPQIQRITENNLLRDPRLIHRYLFQLNDPIGFGATRISFENNQFASLRSIENFLKRQTSALMQKNLHSPPMLIPRANKPFDRSVSRMKSINFNLINSIVERNFENFLLFPNDYYSRFIREDWTSVNSDSFKLLAWRSKRNPLGFGTIVSAKRDPVSKQNILHIDYVSGLSNKSLKDSVIFLLNGSIILDKHFIMGGEDYFFLLKRTDRMGNHTKVIEKLEAFKTFAEAVITFKETHSNDISTKQSVCSLFFFTILGFNLLQIDFP